MRTLDQNALFHVWCKEISNHLRASHVDASPKTVKELVKLTLGNTTELLGTTVAQSTTDYKRDDEDLTAHEHHHKLISFSDFLGKIQAWAATDLNLELSSEELTR